jgi:hypothetical protein
MRASVVGAQLIKARRQLLGLGDDVLKTPQRGGHRLLFGDGLGELCSCSLIG